MSEYNIQMNKYNALNAEYDQLYPATKIENVDGLNTALQNNDPRNWGLGANAKLLTSADNLDNIRENGWYWWYDTRPSGAEYNYCHMRVDNGQTGTLSSVTQTIYRDSINIVMIRFNDGNKWITEYVNPPMQLGEEYRTTERYQGKPVYAKRIHCESMPSGAGGIDIRPSNTEVPNALISTAIVIRCYGRASVEATIPFYSSSEDFMQVGVVFNNTIRIYTAKAYGGTADITVHYVKSTD